VYTASTRSRFGALIFNDVLAGKVALRGQASGQYYDAQSTFGPAASGRTERNAQANLDAVWPLAPRLEMSFGGNYQHRGTEIVGRFAADSTDFAPGAPTRQFDTRPTAETPGFYLENKLRLVGPLYATFGGRLDYTSVPGTWTADPRAALAWRLDAHQTLRVATGRYHQLADVQFLDPVYGNPKLTPLDADHVIAGYEWKSEYGNVRVEGYRKDYHHLVTNDSLTYYANHGTGYARGVDVFVQGTHRWLSGWLSYGYLDTKRRAGDDPVEVPSSWGVRHTATLVGSWQASSSWMLGARYSYGSGRPYTPVVGRTWDPVRQVWRPVFGDHGSATLPEYHRVDLRASRLFTLPKGLGMPASGVCVAYVEGMNVLGIRNVLEYTWNSDYTRRSASDSYFARRLAVAGVALTW
jgi:vitamin B12 transporter